jgi:polyisoprenoid-binding protein YceI
VEFSIKKLFFHRDRRFTDPDGSIVPDEKSVSGHLEASITARSVNTETNSVTAS